MSAFKPFSKPFWVLLLGGGLYIFAALTLSAFIDIGTKLRGISPVFEISFYVVSGGLVLICVVIPVFSVLRAPHLQPDADLNSADPETLRSIARRLIASPIHDEMTQDLRSALYGGAGLVEPIRRTIESRHERVKELVRQQAALAFVSTAISQSKVMDGLILLGINARLILSVVNALGARPSHLDLIKIYTSVLIAAITVESLEDINLEELLGNAMAAPLKDIPFIASASSSVISGSANALVTLYIGLLTKGLITKGISTPLGKERLKIKRSALAMLPGVAKDAWAQVVRMTIGASLATEPKGQVGVSSASVTVAANDPSMA